MSFIKTPKLFAVFVLTLTVLLFTSSCETLPELSYTEENYRITEPFGANWIANGTHYVTTVNSHKYIFDKNIDEEARRNFVISQEKLCEYLEDHDLITNDFTFFVPEDYVCRSDSATKTAYFSVTSQKTSEQIRATLFAVLGDYTNYGYVYALSQFAASELKWETDTVDSAFDSAVFVNSPSLTELVYPCFSEKYASADDINACKQLSMELISKMNDPFSGEEDFLSIVAEYAETNGIQYEKTHLGFAYGGVDCIMKIRTRYMEIFCSSEYVKSDDRLNPELDPMHSCETMIPFFTELDESIYPLRELFGAANDRLVPVNLTDSIKSNNAGLFWPKEENSYIDTESLFVLKHEYIHYLDYTRFINDGGVTEDWSNWTHEVLTTYFSVDQSFLSRKALIESEAVDDPLDLIKNEYDSVEDELLFLRIMLSTTPEKSDLLYYLKTAYSFGASSFGWYFSGLYGDEALVECMIYPERTEEITGMTLDEIVDGWCMWIAETERP